MSIGSLSNWLFNAVVTFTFLKVAWLFTPVGMEIVNKTADGTLTKDPNPAGAFFLYAAISIIGIIWGIRYIPETKGVTLEEIEEYWMKGKKPNELRKG